MNQELKVSIVCDVFNHEKYLRETLDGFVFQQTNFLFEILVHDDASTDSSADIICEYEAKYPDLIKPVYQTVNQYSQNVPIDMTFQIPRIKGEYVAVCEGDDCWSDPLKLQKQVDFMDSHPEYSMCACGSVWYNLKTGLTENRRKWEEDRDVSLEEILLAHNGDFFQYASVMMRAEVFVTRPRWFNLFPIGDYPLSVFAALNGKIRLLADTMTVYRYYAENSWTVRMDNDEARAGVCRKMIDGLEALDEDTGYTHHETIHQRLLQHKYTLALMTHDYQALRSGELKAMYQARSPLKRVSDTIRCKYPKLYTKIGKPLARYVKSIKWKTNKTKS